MAQEKFSIPPEFHDQLRYVESQDCRSDEQIWASLQIYNPVTSEKNVWAFWDTGADNMPGWCKRNVINWIRLCGPSWNVRVLDSVKGSPNFALEFLDEHLLPDAFVKSTLRGPYKGPHSSDFLRGACLYQYGGVYMDVGILLFRDLDRLCWNTLIDENSPYRIATPIMYANIMANHFVASRVNDPFIKAWHDIFLELWSGRTTHEGLLSHPLLAFAKGLSFEDSQTAKFHWEFKVPPETVFEYISQVLSWARLTMLEDTGRGFSGTEYWTSKVFTIDALQEDWSAEDELGFNGPLLFDVLTTPVDAPKESKEYKDAYRAVWRMFSTSSMQKISHANFLTKAPSLGNMLEEVGNEDKDFASGTFASLLRYGSVHFEQTRDNVATLPTFPPPITLKSKLLEAES